MKRIILFALLMTVALTSYAQTFTPKDTPQLEFVMQLRVTLGQMYSVGDTPRGKRNVIPITGGTFEGPKIKGTILNGGADCVYIHIRNCGIISSGTDAEGHPSFYFKCAPKFEAPSNSSYAWLNNAIFVCQPDWSGQGGGITLNVWMVK